MLEIPTKEAVERLKGINEVGQMRGRDRKKVGVDWAEPETVWENDEYAIYYLSHPFDLAALGSLQRHCSGTHWVWACEEKVWQFFALVDKASRVPHLTIHAKDVAWFKAKPHPRDSLPSPASALPQDKEVKTYSGYSYAAPARIPLHCGSGYATYYDVLLAFETAGVAYEPGKFGPVNYSCGTYDYAAWKGMKDAEVKKDAPKIPKEPKEKYSEKWYDWYYQYGSGRYAPPTPKIPLDFQGRPCVILSVTGKGQVDGTEYEDYVKEWYEQHLDTKAKAVI
jgi:hypothetical protein